METITYKQIKNQDVDLINELWEGLRNHHQSKSSYFKDRFAKQTFAVRKKVLLEKEDTGKLRIDVAFINGVKAIAYSASSIDKKGVGELDSIYVDAQFRGNKIGDELMIRTSKWFEDNNVTTRRIVVAEGNEDVFPFYAKYGFYQLFSTLQQR